MLIFNSFVTIVVIDITDYSFTRSNNNLAFDFNTLGTTEFTFNFLSTPGLFCVFPNANLNFVTTATFASGHGWDIMKSLPFINTSNFYASGDAYFNPFFAYASEIFPAGDSYVGTKFKIGTSTYYGWILVNSTGGALGVLLLKVMLILMLQINH